MGIKVFIVDDHSLVRTGLRLTLQQASDIEVVGEAESGEEGLPQIRKLKPDVVLCDLHLPGISGLEVTERIVRGDYGTRVIVVSVREAGRCLAVCWTRGLRVMSARLAMPTN
jgi:two-component system invasion response regulator UvrY